MSASSSLSKTAFIQSFALAIYLLWGCSVLALDAEDVCRKIIKSLPKKVLDLPGPEIVQVILRHPSPSFLHLQAAIDLARLTKSPDSKPLLKSKMNSPIHSVAALAALSLAETGTTGEKEKLSREVLNRLESSEPLDDGIWLRVLSETTNAEVAVEVLKHRLNSLPIKNQETRMIASFLSWKYGLVEYHRLYRDMPRSTWDDFADASGTQIPTSRFEKTHGELYLLGGRATGKFIFREMPNESLLAWSAIPTELTYWKQRGFSYVPIERQFTPEEVASDLGIRLDGVPSFNLPKVASAERSGAFTRVLGPNLGEARHFLSPLEIAHLRERSEVIGNIIRSDLHINHGHNHLENWVLSSDPAERDEIYFIDFDLATRP